MHMRMHERYNLSVPVSVLQDLTGLTEEVVSCHRVPMSIYLCKCAKLSTCIRFIREDLGGLGVNY